MSAPVISIENLTFSYDGFPVLEDVNVAVHEREFACIVGPNGGGKTTLLKLMLGLLQPTGGRVRLFGVPPERARTRVGYLPQSYAYDPQFPVRVMDVVLMGRLDRGGLFGPYRRSDREAALEALRQVEMVEFRHRPLAALSGGQRQRVLIARALACEPEMLLLDEPTASLDLTIEGELYGLLRRLNERLTVVMVSHDIGFVSRFVTKVICVKRQVAVHPTSELTGEMINEIYGSDVCMVRHDHPPDGGQAHG